MNMQTIRWRINYISTIIELKLTYKKKLEWGKGSFFREDFRVLCAKNAHLKIGEKCFFNNNCSINCMGKVSIGANCLFGENVKVYDHNHKFSNVNELISNQGLKIKDVNIGNDVWIGSNTLILAGSRIGNHCVISAGCVINGVIPDNVIVKRNGTYERIQGK